MKTIQIVLSAIICLAQQSISAQSNYVYGVMRTPGQGTNVAAGTIRLGKLDVSNGPLLL